MVGPGFAGPADATRGAGLEGDAVAGVHAGDSRAGGADGARGFVAHYEAGGGVDGFADAAVVPEVDLGGLVWGVGR